MTSGSHGKPYAGWTLPNGSAGGNRRVMEQVSVRARDILEWLIKRNMQKWVSDEYYSSDSSEDEVPCLTEAITTKGV
jgi:hypothetical protein